MNLRLRPRGFSLIDLLMGLVILVIVLSAVFVVRQIIINSRVHALVADFDRVRSATNTYQDRFSHWPGDDPEAQKRWQGSVPSGDGDGVISGSWDRPHSELEGEDHQETQLFWFHLRAASLFSGDALGLKAFRLPGNTVGGIVGVQQSNFGLEGPVVCMSGINSDNAQALDKLMDDGDINTGKVRANLVAHAPFPSQQYHSGAYYFVCRRL